MMTTPQPETPMAAPEGITEKFSENTEPKRKRGRPRAFTAEFEGSLRRLQLLPPTDTERANLNRKYFHHAFHVLAHAPKPERFRYLVPATVELRAGNEKFRRKSILAELGHLDERDMIEWAAIICRKKWPTKEAVRRVREWRLGRESFPTGDAESLALHILKALGGYWSAHSAEDASIWQITREAMELAEAVNGSNEAECRQGKEE
jgi:hypothetical protein